MRLDGRTRAVLTTDRPLRVLLCGVVGASIGLSVGLVAVSLNTAIGGSAPWAFAGAAAVAGVAGGAGYEWARRGSVMVWSGATLLVVLLCGGLYLPSLKAEADAPPLVAALPLGILGLGVLAWALLARRTTALAQAARRLFPGMVEVPLGALSGVAFGLGYGLLFALVQPSPCGPLDHCPSFVFRYRPWFGLSAMLLGATIGGLAFGVILAVALSIGARWRPTEAAHA
jgi:hypothetical protein